MNLTIDVGNTLVKLAVFDESAMLKSMNCKKEEFQNTLQELSFAYPEITDCILASVGEFSGESIMLLDEKYKLLRLNSETKVPFQNNYKTQNTLGVDRIALVTAAVREYPKVDVLVIDAGSCITYDFVDRHGNYLGGAISPGILMRYKAVNTFTKNLPLLEPESPLISIGTDTKEAIHSGVLQGVVFEIEGFIRMYHEKYPNLTVILTGGDAEFLRDSVKSDIFAHSNFLLQGLNYILEHNKH